MGWPLSWPECKHPSFHHGSGRMDAVPSPSFPRWQSVVVLREVASSYEESRGCAKENNVTVGVVKYWVVNQKVMLKLSGIIPLTAFHRPDPLLAEYSVYTQSPLFYSELVTHCGFNISAVYALGTSICLSYFNPFTPKLKKHILPAVYRENV